MGSLGGPELFIILIIIILLFGVGRVSKIGGELGGAIREFRKGLQGDGNADAKNQDDTNKTSA